jgi:hypothetical protein
MQTSTDEATRLIKQAIADGLPRVGGQDHAESAEALVELLGMWGYEAYGRRRQVARPWKAPSDIVITDIGLPASTATSWRRVWRMPDIGTFLIALRVARAPRVS